MFRNSKLWNFDIIQEFVNYLLSYKKYDTQCIEKATFNGINNERIEERKKSAFDNTKMYELSKVLRIIIIEHSIFAEREEKNRAATTNRCTQSISYIICTMVVHLHVYVYVCGGSWCDCVWWFMFATSIFQFAKSSENLWWQRKCALEFTWYPCERSEKKMCQFGFFSPVKSLTLAKQWIEFHWIPSHSLSLSPPTSFARTQRYTCMKNHLGNGLTRI